MSANEIRIMKRSNGKYGVIAGGILRTVKTTLKGASGAANTILKSNPEMTIVAGVQDSTVAAK